MKKLPLQLTPKKIDFPVVVVTGACRSGKTTLARALATLRSIEYCDEPFPLQIVPILQDRKIISKKYAAELVTAQILEEFNNLLLMRGVNFRPADLSYIKKMKTAEEIEWRLNHLITRTDAREYAENEKSKYLCVLAEVSMYMPFIRSAVPDCVVLHVLRNGLSVAADVAGKQWLSDESLLHPSNAIPYKIIDTMGKRLFIPWWVADGDELYFISLNEVSRGAYYWVAHTQHLTHFKITEVQQIIKFEEFLSDPTQKLKQFADLFSASSTHLTVEYIQDMKTVVSNYNYSDIASQIEPKLLEQVRTLLKEFGYETSSN